MRIKSDISGPERGGAGVKMLMVITCVILLANAGYNFVPVAYNGEVFKQEMQTAVVQSMALPTTAGNPVEVTRRRLASTAASFQAPSDALIDVKAKNNVITAHVRYVKDVPLLPFGLYNYKYEFDYTASPNGFITRQ